MEYQMYHPDGLCSFESIIGCEENNPIDDSTITAMFDDLQEGTLLSTLNDRVFHDLVTDSKGSWVVQDLEMSGLVEQSITGNLDLDNLFENVSCRDSLSVVSNKEMPTQNMMIDDTKSAKAEIESSHLRSPENICSSSTVYQMGLKRVTSGSCDSHSSNKGDELSPAVSLQQQLDCVHHDHCYIMNVKESGNKQSSSRSAYSSSSDSLEEGTNSDGGYDTMSVTTSPGTQSTAEHPSDGSPRSGLLAQQVASPIPPILGGHVDPVALIDNRIRHFMSSHEVDLTEEEKLTLKAEGLPIPTTLPLTKTEEKALRNVRRKIRNKVAAQESRKRKKEQLLTLEKRVKDYSTENLILRKRIETLESENKALLARLQKLVAVNSSGIPRLSTQTGACLMIIALCFAVIFGGFTPANPWTSQKQSDYTTSSVRSRSLLSLEHQTSFQSFACSWFHHMIMLHRGFSYFCTNTCGDNGCGEVHLSIPSSVKELANVSGHRHNIDNTDTILYSSLHTSNNIN